VKEEARMTAEPLTPEEEAGVRQMLWEHELAYANVPKEEGVEGWAHIAARLLATLDAARTADPGGLRATLAAEYDGSVCPACHCPDHDPGSCRNCPKCELHTDEALAFVLRVEPELVAALTPEATVPGLDTRRLGIALLAVATDPDEIPLHRWDLYSGSVARHIVAEYARLTPEATAPDSDR
jgi:hypothetical protein